MNTNDTNTQLLTYIASMVLRTHSQLRHLQARLEILESADSATAEMLKECFSSKAARRLTELELEGFGEQFPDLMRFASEYSEMSETRFHEGVVEAAGSWSRGVSNKRAEETG